MNLDITPWVPDDIEIVRRLMRESEIAHQFENKLGTGDLERWLADPYCHPELRFVARSNGRPVGFAFGFLLPGEPTSWAMLRLGVLEPDRRRGIGSRLLQAQTERLPRFAPECREIGIGAWEPCEPAAGFAAAHGYALARHFWRMEVDPDGLRDPEWPAGITTREFDGSERALEDWSDIHNASFASHYRFVPSTVASCRAIAAAPGFNPSAVLLAYDGERCIGYCRDDAHSAGGEIATLGVAPEAQGRGLGRALLRWGAQWLARRDALPLGLLVDGENETALRLYRSEGFRVVRTRTLWMRPLSAA